MFRAGRLIALSAVLLLGCAHPGYRVHLEVKGIGPSEQERFLRTAETEIRTSGFSIIFDRREDSGHFPGMFTSSYAKVLSNAWHDHTAINIFCYTREDRLAVDIANLVRGMEPPVKAEIDALGDWFIANLSATVGRERISVVRERARVPLLRI